MWRFKLLKYEDRLIVPINSANIKLFSKNKTLLITEYERIVIGGRGPYVECKFEQIVLQNFHIPPDQLWRTQVTLNNNAYYVEYRSNDKSNVKLYYQLKLVDYADYKLNLFYISPFDLYLDTGQVLIEPLRKKREHK